MGWFDNPRPDTVTLGPGGARAPTPGKSSSFKPYHDAQEAKKHPAQGTESGPGILQSWFDQRATGTDPAFEYGLKRGMTDLGNRYSAAGAFNSGAARQGESDLYANLLSQRMGQLDALAGGASGEHQGSLNSMLTYGIGLASGRAGLSSAYDFATADSQRAANEAIRQLNLNKAGVDSQGTQAAFGNIGSIYGMGRMFGGGGRGGGGGAGGGRGGGTYDPNGLMSPSF